MIKNDIASDAFMSNLYAKYAVEDVAKFRQTCIDAISQLAGNEGKKLGFIHDLKKVNNKDRMVTKTTNFIMAGQGFKVL